MSLKRHGAFNRMYQKGKMTLGFLTPFEPMTNELPRMENTVELARKIEDLGFSAIWLRDVTMQDLNSNDHGQLYDLWIYLTYLAARTNHIALGTSSVVLPLRHPVRVVKEATSVDRLFPNRLIMGVASGDRQKDFTALGIEREKRGDIFKQSFNFLERLLKEDRPTVDSSLGSIDGRNMKLIPNPVSAIPTMVTGFSQQSMEWIAEHGDGWIQYPRSIKEQASLIQHYRALADVKNPGIFKPFTQTLYIDLSENPDELPTSIPLGYRLGRHHLLELLYKFQEVGVNHLAFVPYFATRPVEEMIQEIGEEILSHFPTHTSDN
ncbi:TIGR03571 family LLM class oxidoreductase [Domibacillus sp. DTU_2020_1001157_1_SI_ALB_TIR_016]|uniref:TIGR03571 family LLM class oxidoreductase n=1 Tax=Domibacillus sp. DTU_2020_1001157_1_SI_ALB_TIR_016 TaxID=3077789 RepID=UPI0028EFE2E6|nr:TIGR03571 family LLM class oxidoreductase [Domibacillus sp. DTU_2020_1001157_1_SI_ALB_TIR_016]WNS79573.1 TIGR03571 family LLM class oxidoreductase [Domibacillus sp. DTU_2020_1001157_1_SI_ALB_TIR_016]